MPFSTEESFITIKEFNNTYMYLENTFQGSRIELEKRRDTRYEVGEATRSEIMRLNE